MAIFFKSSGAVKFPPDLACTARRFWYSVIREPSFPLCSPFAVCLASGTLKIETFRHYVAQEAHFLKAVAQAYALAAEYVDDDDDDAKLAISELRKDVLKELEMHDSFVQEWGSDLVEESPVNSATLKLTEFLLATASGKIEPLIATGKLATPFEKTRIPAYVLGAVTACLFLYAFLGFEFQELLVPNEKNHPYKKWIEKYSSESYQASALKTEELLDKLSVSFTGEELDIIAKLYQQVMKLEIEFFYAQVLNQPTVVPLTKEHDPAQDRLVIFSGFDLTCTDIDSFAILAEMAIVIAPKYDQNKLEGEIARMSDVGSSAISAETAAVASPKSDQNKLEGQIARMSDADISAILAKTATAASPKSDRNQLEGEIVRMSSAEMRSTWDLISKQYTEEYERCIESILQPDGDTEIYWEFNYEALHKALEQVGNFEKRANSRVIESGVLRGLNLENIKRTGELLSLQHGCLNFFQKIAKNENLNANIHIISYCWCADFIRAAFSSGDLDGLNIHANELSFEESLSTGEIVGKVQSPHDKLQAFGEILGGYSNDRKNLTVYIGDAVGDLLCLLKADIGIVLGSSSSLRRVGLHYGISFVPLFRGLVKKQRECAAGSPAIWKRRSGILYTASDWCEIHAFILGC